MDIRILKLNLHLKNYGISTISLLLSKMYFQIIVQVQNKHNTLYMKRH